MSIVSATATYWLLVRDEKVAIDNLAPTLLYPTTGLLATATAGSVVVSYTPLTIGLSMPVVVVSYFLLGAGESHNEFQKVERVLMCRIHHVPAHHVGAVPPTVAQSNARAEKGCSADDPPRSILQRRILVHHARIPRRTEETCL